jgi:hypothetical protein
VLCAYYVKLAELSTSDCRRLSAVTQLGEVGSGEVRTDLLSYAE